MKSYINKHHFKRYKNFIQTRGIPSTQYTEKHHVIPKSVYLNNNVVKLTAREHYIAHKILTKVFNKNTKYWFSMAKAFNRMFILSKTHDRYINSGDYAYRKQLHSDSMKYNNPMHNPTVAKKAAIAMRLSWTTERREKHSVRCSVPCKQSVKDKLSKRWTGVLRPKKIGQVDKNIAASSCGIFSTPFGNFNSPGQASRSSLNITHLSRYMINKYCKNMENTLYAFIPNGKLETRGYWKKSN